MEDKFSEKLKKLDAEELEKISGGIINENIMRSGITQKWKDPEQAAIVIRTAIFFGFKDFARKTYLENKPLKGYEDEIKKLFREAFGEEI